ncbi:hypothetical protein MPSEU_000780400 [Mayamaea pseudoterrestris]|nr:hypothetical protein MPSEU_000780400 [Mayamaea pseudoterrestris]
MKLRHVYTSIISLGIVRVDGFAPFLPMKQQTRQSIGAFHPLQIQAHQSDQHADRHSPFTFKLKPVTATSSRQYNKHGLASTFLALSLIFSSILSPFPSFAEEQQYDGFANYAKDNQMEQSDVSCFVKKCGDQTQKLFANPRGIKGVVCLGKCKGEQSCATRCFAEYGSEPLNDWLSCTIEENECVKVPKNLDNSAADKGYPTAIQNFDPKSLVGTWYKTDGLNPNYDLFDCQSNTFQQTSPNELDMGIFFRVKRPAESGGGFWENALTEHMVVDEPSSDPTVSTMHTSGKMYGLTFQENWYILGESDGSKGIPPYKLVAYKGHTLQGNYEGAFVYAKERILPAAAVPSVKEAAAKAGLDFDKFTRIDNTCPTGNVLNDAQAGTGTSGTDWFDLVVGDGGVLEWISPGWRGDYKK